MNSPCCDYVTKVLETREHSDIACTKRRRQCENCGRRYTTYERYPSKYGLEATNGVLKEIVELAKKGMKAAEDDKLYNEEIERAEKRNVEARTN
jgi:transcriptional repressor NrdR